MSASLQVKLLGIGLLLIGLLIGFYLFSNRSIPADKIKLQPSHPADVSYRVTVKSGAYADPEIWVTKNQRITVLTAAKDCPILAKVGSYSSVMSNKGSYADSDFGIEIYTSPWFEGATVMELAAPTKLYLGIPENSSLSQVDVIVQIRDMGGVPKGAKF